MFHYHFKTKKNKRRPNHRVFYKEYIDTGNERASHAASNISSEVQAELHGSIFAMRREFKSTTKRVRKLYSNKEPQVSIYETSRLAKHSLAKVHTTA